MGDSRAQLGVDADADRFNRFAAWEMPTSLLARSVSDLPNRLKLATAAATQRDFEQLERELSRIGRDAPLAQVVVRLSLPLDPLLRDLPGGAASALAQLVHPPPDDAWLIDQRQAIAEFCRYAMEADALRPEESDETRAAMRAFVRDRARHLIDAID
jgi:hypothetical protein